MAKRPTGVGRQKNARPHKTKKRLEAKRVMLAEKVAKKMKHTRVVRLSA